MPTTACTKCRARHSPNQLCLAQLFEIRLGLKDDHRSFGRLVISANTEDDEVFNQMERQYAIRVSRWTRYTRFLILSKRLFVVSRMLESCILFQTSNRRASETSRLGLRPCNGSAYDKKRSYY